MWQQTAILFGFYWLFRWLWPGLLPETLRTADFKSIIFVCAIGGMVLTAFRLLFRAGGGGPRGGAPPRMP